MSEDWVKIEVDGVELEAKKGAMLIEVTDAAGIRIPRFCYHKKLSIAANCRMCLVEVEKAPKPLPACATPIMNGMKVKTSSPKAIDAQQGTMEFLLINHPLDCPICDQGGECELQDVSMGYGAGVSRFSERKRAVQDKDIGPLIETEMTRCIHCTRCVRFGEEISGLRELGATGRGEHMEIGTFVEHSVASELSGNVIDLCPVGALTAKPSRFAGRSWEYTQHASVAPHDSVGSNTFIHTIRGKVMRVVPRENEDVNEVWLSDRDRFSYEAIYSDDRALRPLLKGVASDWETALNAAGDGLKQIVAQHGGDAVGVLVSPTATLEELYLAQKLARGFGSNNVDHRLRQADFSADAASPPFPWLGQSLAELESVDAALLVGSNVRMEQPLAGHRLRKAALQGGKIMFVNSRDFDFRFAVAAKLIANPAAMVDALAGVAKAAASLNSAEVPNNLQSLLGACTAGDSHDAIARNLTEGESATLLLGPQAIAHPAFAGLQALAVFIARTTNAALGYLPEAANNAGAWLAGAVPHRAAGCTKVEDTGLNARQMLQQPRKAYVLIGIEPELDCWDGAAALAALNQAELVVSLSSYVSNTLNSYADVILPLAVFAETSGTFVNAEGRWQSFQGACQPLGEARPGWKILRVLGNLLEIAGFDQVDSRQVHDEIQTACAEIKPDNLQSHTGELPAGAAIGTVIRSGAVPTYGGDAVVRRAPSLQRTVLAEHGEVRLNPAMAEQLGLNGADRAKLSPSGASGASGASNGVALPLVLDESIPAGCVWVPTGVADCIALGPVVGSVEVGTP